MAAIRRAWMSVWPPAGNGTTIRISLPGIGKVCAMAAAGRQTVVAHSMARKKAIRVNIMNPSSTVEN